MRVLALVPGGVEEQLLFFPTLDRLHSSFPNADITVAADPAAKAVYALSKAGAEVIPYRFQADNSPADWANLLGTVRDREFEAVLTGTTSWSVALLLWLSGIPLRIGYDSSANRLLLTKIVAPPSTQDPAAQFYALAQSLQVAGPLPPMTISVSQADIAAADKLRQQAGLADGGYVALYAGPLANGDAYPAASWNAVIDSFLTRQPDLPVMVLQMPDSGETATDLQRLHPELKRVVPESLGQLAALITGANLLVSPEAYPLYLATALGVYAVGLFGHERPEHRLPPACRSGEKLQTLRADSGKLSDIDPSTVIATIWGE